MTTRSLPIRRFVVALAAAALAAGAVFLAARLGSRGNPSAHAAESATTPTPAGSRPAPVVHRPPGLSRAQPVPLVVAMHPSGGTPAGFETNSGLDAVADEHGFVVAYLGSPTRSPAWLRVDMPANLAYVSKEIKSISASENIDPTRVFVTGFSAGATMTLFVGCMLSSQVDGVAAVSGAMLRRGEPCTVSHPVSELLVVGTNEHIPTGGSAELLSTGEVAAGWRARDGCTGRSTSSASGPVSRTVWTQCNERSGVGLYLVRNGIHAWPGAPGLHGPDSHYDAAQGVWAFFASHPGAPAATVSASLTSVHVASGGHGRSVSVVLALREPVSVSATLALRGSSAVRREATMARATRATVLLAVPRAAKAGRATLTLRLADSYTRHATITRTMSLPG